MLPAWTLETTGDVYDRLMLSRRGDPVEETLARMLASWSQGLGCMPDWLGLDEERYVEMMNHHFPGFDWHSITYTGYPFDAERMDEMHDLHELLMRSRSSNTQAQTWMVDILVAGCMGSEHLWQDLGLWCRADLSKLMTDNFQSLASRNDKDMKWKKFLYKQLCEAEGIYTCRSPSCETCDDYQACFGPEE